MQLFLIQVVEGVCMEGMIWGDAAGCSEKWPDRLYGFLGYGRYGKYVLGDAAEWRFTVEEVTRF